ncbi:MAG: hypothetical protein IIV77_02580, partial [Bacteroidaceae bacterium]|nr:hypothetical protein [Bacteroidaceae bacterium]
KGVNEMGKEEFCTSEMANIVAGAQVGTKVYETLEAAAEAAQPGEKVKLLANTTGTGFVINKDITIDFGGKTYSFNEGVGSTGTESNGFQILKNNNVVLKNGTLNVAADAAEKFYILVQNYANLTVENMNLDGTNLDKWSKTDGDSYVLSNNSGKVFVKGNTNITANNDGDKAFAFDACTKTSYEAPVVTIETTGHIAGKIENSATIVIKSGTYTVDVTEWCEVGYVAQLNENGVYEIVKDPTSHYITTVEDLKAFRNAVNRGENNYAGVTVYLAADIDLNNEEWEPIGTFDNSFDGNFYGQGHVIKNLKITDNTAANGEAYAALFGVTANNVIKDFVIENVTIASEGQIVAAAIAYPYYTTVSDIKVCGDIAIEGGNYTAGVLAYTRLCQNASNLTVVGNNGSYITGAQVVGGVVADTQMNKGLVANYSNFSAEGVIVSGTKNVGGISGIVGNQTLDGVIVKNVTLSCSDARVGIVAGCMGVISTISNATYENVTGATALIGATYDGAKAIEAKIDNTYYATLEDALAAKGNEVVELLVPYVVAKGETVTLDLNGKTVSMEDASAATAAMIKNNGNLTITDSSDAKTGKLSFKSTTPSASNSYASNAISNYGTLTINGGTVENLSMGGACYALDNYAGSTATISGGKLYAEKTSVRIFNWTNGEDAKATLNIEGGEIYSKDGYGVNVNAGNAPYVALNISGGTITTDDTDYNLAVYVINKNSAENFTANVTGGTFNGNFALNGVTSETMTTGNLSVSGGTFDGVICYSEPAYGFITGGTYNNEVEENYLVLGYQMVGDTAPYTVEYTGKRVELALVDGKVTEFVNEQKVTVGTLTYKRSFSKYWTPFYVPFEVPVSMLADKFYVARINDVRRTDNNNDGELDDFDMEIIYIHGGNADGSSKTLKANYPYFICSKSNSGAEMNITLNNATLYAAKENTFDCTTMTEKFEIKGVYSQIQSTEFDTEFDYIVGLNEEGKHGWIHIAEGSFLNPFRFYMTMSSRYEDEPVAPMKSMRITVRGEEDENGATIIYDVVEDNLNNNGNDFIYDLQGRRVSEPKKGGIYIKNGKKILY